MANRKSIAIIGAGISGLTLAQELSSNFDVCVFEKSRGVGGRMATRYAGEYFFDHGAPFFTARGKRFQKFVHEKVASGAVSVWEGKVITLEKDKKTTDRIWFEPHFTGNPKMNSLCAELADGIAIKTNIQIAKILPLSMHGYRLFDTNEEVIGEFDIVVSTAPPLQTHQLFENLADDIGFLSDIEMLPQFSLMIGIPRKWEKSWIAAKVNNSPIGWIYSNSTKSARDKNLTTLVVGSALEFSLANIECEAKQIGEILLEEARQLLQLETEIAFQSCHKWRYALPPSKDEMQIFWRPEIGIGAIGDWCGGEYSPVENAWNSAKSLAAKIVKLI